MYKTIILSLALIFSISILAQERPPFSNKTVKSQQWEGVLFAPYSKGKFETKNLGLLSNKCGTIIKNAATRLALKIKGISENIAGISKFNPV